MIRAALIIDPRNQGVIVLRAWHAKQRLSARIGGTWKFARDKDGWFAEQGRIDAVIDKWTFQRSLPPCVASRRSVGREVTGQHRCGRNECDRIRRVLSKCRPL